MFYSVVLNYDDRWEVCSFLGKDEQEEMKFALCGYKECALVTINPTLAHEQCKIRNNIKLLRNNKRH